MKTKLLIRYYPWFLSCLLLLAASLSFAADDIRTERVKFKPGASTAVIEARIKGY